MPWHIVMYIIASNAASSPANPDMANSSPSHKSSLVTYDILEFKFKNIGVKI